MSLIKLTELTPKSNYSHEAAGYTLREIYINPDHVVCIREEHEFRRKLMEGRLPKGLDKRQEFSRVTLSSNSLNGSMVVIGSPTLIEGKLERKQLLKG